MAEAIARLMASDSIEAFSAGTELKSCLVNTKKTGD